jgi:apolipoprotein N-acyltransferase
MGFVSFLLVFLIGIFISLFLTKKTVIGLFVISFGFIGFYLFGPLDFALKMDNNAILINGGVDSNIYLDIEEIKKAFDEINDEVDAAKNLESVG